MPLSTMQGVTPTIIIKLPTTIDLTQASHVYVTFKQNKVLIKMVDDCIVSEHQVEIYLSQEDTLMFERGAVEIQVNWTYATGQRGATRPRGIEVAANHLREVLP